MTFLHGFGSGLLLGVDDTSESFWLASAASRMDFSIFFICFDVERVELLLVLGR